MDEILFVIYKGYLFISLASIPVFFSLSVYLMWKALTIKTDLTITYSKLIKINKALIINFFIMFFLSLSIPIVLTWLL